MPAEEWEVWSVQRPAEQPRRFVEIRRQFLQKIPRCIETILHYKCLSCPSLSSWNLIRPRLCENSTPAAQFWLLFGVCSFVCEIRVPNLYQHRSGPKSRQQLCMVDLQRVVLMMGGFDRHRFQWASIRELKQYVSGTNHRLRLGNYLVIMPAA